MKLYGSLTSPYARKLRLLFAEVETKQPSTHLEFVVLDIYQKDRELLKSLSPVLKIPIFEENGKRLYDSRVIFQEFVSKGWHPKLNWRKENLLTTIDGAMDSLINRFLLKRSNVVLDPKSVLALSHSERLDLSFHHLEEAAKEAEFHDWDYISMSLFCLLDWVVFRELYPLENFSKLREFHSRQRERPSVQATDPRIAV